MHRPAIAVVAALVLGGCASLQSSDSILGLITPYRVEIVQGNVITKEQADAVKPGMTRAQVRDVLGSPLLADPFHAERWDYIFTIKRQGAEPQRRSVVAMFEGEALKSLDVPEELPSEQAFVASISTDKSRGTPPVLELTEEQRKALPAPRRAEAAAPAAPTGPGRSFPPLEPVQ